MSKKSEESEKSEPAKAKPTKAESASLTALPRLGLEYGASIHLLACLLSLITLIFLIIAYCASAVPQSDTPGGTLGSIQWLVHVNQTTATTIPGLPVGDGSSVGRWGLGTFGWCKWTYNGAEMMQEAECTKKFGWTLPGSAKAGDEIVGLDLPDSLGGALPVLAQFLLISILAMLGYTFLLPEYALYSGETTSANAPDQGARLAAHDRIRGFKWGGVVLSVAWVIVLAVVIAIGVGVVAVERGEKGLEAELGVGGVLLATTLALIPITHLLVSLGGLRVTHKKRKGARSGKV